MEFLRKMAAKHDDKYGKPPVTLAFLGDSVTQGCFEIYETGGGGLDTVYDPENNYANKVASILRHMCPGAQLNVIAAGISGDSAPNGNARLERDILPFKPDLTVVCYGLNDSGGGLDGIGRYTDALEAIFTRLQEAGSEVIFMTPNTMNYNTSCHLTSELFRGLAVHFAGIMENGVLDAYIEAAKATAAKCGVPVVDCYAKWKGMQAAGVNTTELLSNKLNHPTREMHWMFAWMLAQQIIG
ncbi:MAG: GDSL family lipase [Clostridia bacterium]|nr:GDSL family lipase [Clostridia bacterium]